MSKNHFMGLGVARTGYNFNGPRITLGDHQRPAIQLDYIFKTEHPANHKISSSPQPATFAKMDQYQFSLERTLEFLGEKVPQALLNLTQYMERQVIRQQQLTKMKDYHINTILYGPPGTGKTHELNALKKMFTDELPTGDSPATLREKMKDYTYWEIIAAILYASDAPMNVKDICAHALYAAKFNPANKVKPQNMAWVDLQAYATDESTNSSPKYRRGLQIFEKNSTSEWSIAANKREEVKDLLDEELLQLAANPVVPEAAIPIIHERYYFVTFHQKYSYEDFIEGIRPVLSGQNPGEENAELQFRQEKGIFYQACLEALQLAGFDSFSDAKKQGPDARKERFNEISKQPGKQFAILIDEINRANISAVFGELITLIEDNKRMGQESELWLKLPYSGEDFCVPPNLYVLGTMNTADKSIALLDIALRRRFEFKPMYPLYSLPEDVTPWWAEKLEKLNEAIYKAKNSNPDFFIGHAFFIGKAPADLAHIYNRKIIPLLLEYFQNNTQKVETLLTTAGVENRRGTIRENYHLIAV
jgi:5-methylcytosine-specific restriction protein B